MKGITDELVKHNSAELVNMAKYLTTPMATYTHTSNKSVVVSAVDIATDTFTSVGHTLVNTDIVFPISNYDAGNIYPINVYPGGIGYVAAGYYVVNKTPDTFQLSLTSGGAAIDLTANASLDLTKWHFETGTSILEISGIPSSPRIMLRIKGKCLKANAQSYVTPDALSISQEYLKNGGTTYDYPLLSLGGDISTDCEVIVDYTKMLMIKGRGLKITSSTVGANAVTLVDNMLKSPKYRESTITKIVLTNWMFANGTVVEVYKA